MTQLAWNRAAVRLAQAHVEEYRTVFQNLLTENPPPRDEGHRQYRTVYTRYQYQARSILMRKYRDEFEQYKKEAELDGHPVSSREFVRVTEPYTEIVIRTPDKIDDNFLFLLENLFERSTITTRTMKRGKFNEQ
jgi:hypothetical protein